jgi:hypothetical protein
VTASTAAALKDTPAVAKGVAGAFGLCVMYFVAEHFFLAEEYYAGSPPYVAIAICAAAGGGLVFLLLRRWDAGGASHATYSTLAAIGFGLAVYGFLPRLNIWTAAQEPAAHLYTLDENFVWQPASPSMPPLNLYLHASRWWGQFGPGDTYSFHLRRGGLGFWQVDMRTIYAEQKRYYDCDGVLSCLSK